MMWAPDGCTVHHRESRFRRKTGGGSLCLLFMLIGLAALAPCQEPRTPAQIDQRARVLSPDFTVYDWFFRHVLGTDFFPSFQAPAKPPRRLSAADAARQFAMSASELNLAKAIATDWRGKIRVIDDQIRKLYTAGESSGSPRVNDLSARRMEITSDHIDRLKAALGPDRFAEVHAAVAERFRNRPSPRVGPQITVLETDGKSTVGVCGTTYPSPYGDSGGAAVFVVERNGAKETYNWQDISKVEIVGGQATISFANRAKIAGAGFPAPGALSCDTESGRTVEIPLSNIRRIIVPEPPRTRPPVSGGPGRA